MEDKRDKGSCHTTVYLMVKAVLGLRLAQSPVRVTGIKEILSSSQGKQVTRIGVGAGAALPHPQGSVVLASKNAPER